MRQVRVGTFETNSSSTHSMIICTEQELKDWKNNKICYDDWSARFVNLNPDISDDEVKEYYTSHYNGSFYKSFEDLSDKEIESVRELVRLEYSADYLRKSSYNSWYTYCHLETFEKHFTTPSGDKMVAIGKYGYDG